MSKWIEPKNELPVEGAFLLVTVEIDECRYVQRSLYVNGEFHEGFEKDNAILDNVKAYSYYPNAYLW